MMLPKEHGSWAVLIAPIALGLALAPGALPPAAVLFCVGALGAFLLRVPLEAGQRGRLWAAAYGALAAAGLLPLLVRYGRWGLLGFGVPALVLFAVDKTLRARRQGLSAANELIGIAGLTLGAPAAYYAACGTLRPEAWLLWALCVLYFWGPVFYVKMAALQHRTFVDPSQAEVLRKARGLCLSYHAGAFLAGALLAAKTGASWPVLVPFLAAFGKTGWRAMQGPARVRFQSLGWQEVAFAALFTVCVWAGLPGQPS